MRLKLQYPNKANISFQLPRSFSVQVIPILFCGYAKIGLSEKAKLSEEAESHDLNLPLYCLEVHRPSETYEC